MIHDRRRDKLNSGLTIVLKRTRRVGMRNDVGSTRYWVRAFRYWDKYRVQSCGGHNLFFEDAESALAEAERIFSAEEYTY